MTRLIALCAVLAALQLGCDKSAPAEKGVTEPGVISAQTAAFSAAELIPDSKPWPAGTVLGKRIIFEFSVYALPAGKGDVMAAAKAIHRKRFSHISAIDKAADLKAKSSAVIIDSPAVSEYAPLDKAALKYFGVGLSETEVSAVQKSPKVVTMTFVSDTESVLSVQADALAMADAIAAQTGGLIWDEDTRQLFSRQAWATRLSKPLTDLKNLKNHFTHHAYRTDPGVVRIVTLGLTKFGLPNVVVEQVPMSLGEDMATIVSLVAVTLAEKKSLASAGKLNVSLDLMGLEKEPGSAGRASVQLRHGAKEEGDPPGRLMQITFPGPVASLQQRQIALTTAFFGAAKTH